jgi:hypothetical protein
MPNGTGSKRERRNLNLTAETFSRIEKVRRRKQKELGTKLSWDSFFGVVMAEYERITAEVKS